MIIEEAIANLLKNYQTLLEQPVANPDQHLFSLPLFAKPAAPTPPSQPWDSLVPITLSVYQLVKGEYSCEQFREGKQIFSPMRSNMTQPIAVGTKRS